MGMLIGGGSGGAPTINQLHDACPVHVKEPAVYLLSVLGGH